MAKLPELRLERRAHFRSRPADDRRVGLRFRTATAPQIARSLDRQREPASAAGGHVGGDARNGDAEPEPRVASTSDAAAASTSGDAASIDGDRSARGDGDAVTAADEDGSIRAGSGPHDVETEWVSTEVRDLGVGGAFVATYRALPIGTALEVEVDLPGAGAALAVRAEVRWLAEPGRQPPGRDAGMGLAFAPLDTDGLLAVSEYLAGAAGARA